MYFLVENRAKWEPEDLNIQNTVSEVKTALFWPF